MLGIPGTPSIPGDPVEAGVNLVTGGETKTIVNAAPAADNSDALLYLSDNNKTTSLAQIQSQRLQMLQVGIDRQMQHAADLELGLEKLDTNLQVSRLDFVQRMSAEENRHVEKMTQAGKGLQKLSNTYSLGADLPPPSFDEES
ncbi:MAG TPA: hypothetical protein VFX30_00100 [bacterium]|nr:hypothetical protein [bacterium]